MEDWKIKIAVMWLVFAAAGIWIPGHLHYGWLLLQTVTSAPTLWIAAVFTAQFTLWLFPTAGLAALLIIEKLGASHFEQSSKTHDKR